MKQEASVVAPQRWRPSQGNRAQSDARLLRSTIRYPFELQAQLLDAQTPFDLFKTAVLMMARVPGTVRAWVYQRDELGALVCVQSWQAPHLEPAALPTDDLAMLIHQRWIAAHGSGHSAPEAARPFVPPNHPACVVIPMLVDDELIGAVAAERRDGSVFPYAPEDVVTLISIAAVTAQRMETLVLRQRLATSDRSVDHQEFLDQERRRIGRELHDGIVQDLAYLQVKLELIGRLISRDVTQAQNEVRELRAQVDLSIAGLRGTIGDLRRPRPATRGLTGQLRALASRMGDYQPTLELDLSEVQGVRLAPEIERAAVGIIREALQNIRKHAQASRVRVEVQREADGLQVVVADDGIGIRDTVTRNGEQHFGMEQMRELAEDMGGSLRVESAPASGTSVYAWIPLGPAGDSRRTNG